jgi:sodium-coupled monocarboxylate transporter 8/12
MIMGAPTEVYLYGTLYWMICISILFVALATNYIYMPVFFELQLTSTYEVCSTRLYYALPCCTIVDFSSKS